MRKSYDDQSRAQSRMPFEVAKATGFGSGKAVAAKRGTVREAAWWDGGWRLQQAIAVASYPDHIDQPKISAKYYNTLPANLVLSPCPNVHLSLLLH